MGFFEKIFGKKQEPQEPVPLKCSFSELVEALVEEKKSKQKKLEEETLEELAKIRQSCGRIRDLFSRLKEEPVPENTPQHVVSRLLAMKKRLLEKTLNLLNRLSEPKGFEQSPQVSSDLDALIKTLVPSFGLVKVLSSDGAEFLKKELKNAGEGKKRLDELLAEKKVSEKTGELVEKAVGIDEKLRESRLLEKRFQEKKNEISEQQKQMETQWEGLKKFHESSGFLEASKKRLAQQEEEKRLRAQIVETLGHINKAMRKYSKTGVLENQDLVENYLENPVEAALSEGPQTPGLKKALDGLKNAVLRGKLGLKPNVREKTLQTIEKIQNGSLSIILRQYAESKNQEIPQHVFSEKQEKEQSFKETKQKLEDLEKEAEELQSSAKKKQKEALEEKRLLVEESQRVLGRKIILE